KLSTRIVQKTDRLSQCQQEHSHNIEDTCAGLLKQIPLSLRRNLLPGKLINRTLLMSHHHLARTLVQLLAAAKTSSCSNAGLHDPPEAFDRIKVVATMGW